MQQQKDLTKGNVNRQLWSLAWPMMLSFFFHTLYNIVDAFWVGKLSADAIAAVSISQISLFLMMSIGFGVTVGSGVLMAMELGAKKIDGAERILGQSFVLMIILALLFTGPAIIFKDTLLALSGATGAIWAPAQAYFTITTGGSFLFFTLIAIMFAFNAQGDTFTLTKLFALSTGINLLLDPLLIFGTGPFPELGVAGAAWATLVSQLVFIIIALRSLASAKRQVRFRFKNLQIRLDSVKEVLKIGLPAALTQLLNPIGLAVMTNIASKAFQEPGAIAFSLAFRIEFFAYLPAVGYGFAAMAMMGQSIGAHNLDRAKAIFRKCLRWGAGLALVLGLAAALFAPQIVGLFTNEQVVMDYTVQYFRTVAFVYAFLAAVMIQANGFQAIGRSWPGFWITVLRLFVIIVPLSLYLIYVQEMSMLGLWIAMTVGNVASAVVGYFWINRSLERFKFKAVDAAMHSA